MVGGTPPSEDEMKAFAEVVYCGTFFVACVSGVYLLLKLSLGGAS